MRQRRRAWRTPRGPAKLWRLVGLLLLAWLCLPRTARALPTQTWLLSIGNNQGDGDELGLRFAERDAQQIADVLRQHGGISSRNTSLLLGETAPTVRRALQDLNAEIRNQISVGQPSALIVFYSGHADAGSLHLRGTELPLDELKKLVQGSPAAVRLLIVDACRSGTITRVKGVRATDNFDIQLDDSGAAEGVAIVTSSAAGESSQESDRLRGSFFTHHLINALRGAADRNGDGKVTLPEAYTFTYDQTLRSSGRSLELQLPTYSFDVKGREELVLTIAAAVQAQLGRLRLGGRSLYLVSEERDGGPMVAEIAPPRDQTTLLLPSGHYFVQQRLRSEYREYQVLLAAGTETDLSRQPYRSVQYDRLVRYRGGGKTYAHNATVLAGARGAVLTGEGVGAQLHIGYGLDLPWLSASVRLRGLVAHGVSTDGLLPQSHYELGAGVLVQRFVDVRPLSVSFGLVAELVRHHQTFDGDRSVASRGAWGFAFGGLLAVEIPLAHGLSLRAEAGPMTELFPQVQSENGVEVGQTLASPFTWWAAGGLIWRR